MITPLWKMKSVEEITPFALMRENLPAIAAKFHAQIMGSQALSPDDKANVLRLNARPG